MRRIALLPALSIPFGGCVLGSHGTTRMAASSVLPAAEGWAQFSETDDKNTSVKIAVRHLAHPERLTPPAQTYVVWVQPTKNDSPQNIGALTVDENLKGSLTAVTPQSSFELFITAEAAPNAKTPAGEPLLWTTYTR